MNCIEDVFKGHNHWRKLVFAVFKIQKFPAVYVVVFKSLMNKACLI